MTEPHIGKLFLFAVLGLLDALFCGLRAGHHLYEKRSIRCAAWLCLGALAAFVMISLAWIL